MTTSLRASWDPHKIDLRVNPNRDVILPSVNHVQTLLDPYEATSALSLHLGTQATAPNQQEKSDGARQDFVGPRPYIDVTAYGARRRDGLTK